MTIFETVNSLSVAHGSVEEEQRCREILASSSVAHAVAGEEQRPATCTAVLAAVYPRAEMMFAAGGGDRAAALEVRDGAGDRAAAVEVRYGAADFAHK